MNLRTLRAFRDEMEKIAARAGLRVIRRMVSSGDITGANRLTAAAGVLKKTPFGHEIKDLGIGSEGLATLIAHPERGLEVRKIYNPKGLSTPAMIARKEEAGKALANDPNFAQFRESVKTPGGVAHHYEYVQGSHPITNDQKGQRMRDIKAHAMRSARKAGYNVFDLSDANVVEDAAGRAKIVDYLPSKRLTPKGSPSVINLNHETSSVGELKKQYFGVKTASTEHKHTPVRMYAGTFDTKKLWEHQAKLPVAEESVSHLWDVQKDRKVWMDEGGRVSPKQTLMAKEGRHWDLVQAADKSYPIILHREPGGRLRIVDGVHRLAKARLDGDKTIKAVWMHELPESAKVKTSAPEQKMRKS